MSWTVLSSRVASVYIEFNLRACQVILTFTARQNIKSILQIRARVIDSSILVFDRSPSLLWCSLQHIRLNSTGDLSAVFNIEVSLSRFVINIVSASVLRKIIWKRVGAIFA
jgi:hypothetical protein